VQVLGGPWILVRPEEVFHFVAGRLARGESAVVANHNLHSLYLIRKARDRAFFQTADLIEVDSVPLIFWARVSAGPAGSSIAAPIWTGATPSGSAPRPKNWKVFFVGGAPGVADKAREKILSDWPDGVRSGHPSRLFRRRAPARPRTQAVVEADQRLQARHRAGRHGHAAPGNLGAGEPCGRHRALRDFTVGGAFDYEAGVQRAGAALDGADGHGVAVPADGRSAAAVQPLLRGALVPDRPGPRADLAQGLPRKTRSAPTGEYRRAADLASL
jgi:N-acetylglucosaminyldiphosphoundecaprenol N-acetyl-beta-D-mannosaminyltransferase